MVSHTLSVFHLSFWSPKICTRVKSLLLRCVTCCRQSAKTVPKPPLSPLPAERVQWQCLFATVGVDHTGHFYARDAQGQRIKLYICLFICATTRAIHLEVVDNLSMKSFILCLRHLTAAKGVPSVILSDNHRTFISGEKFLPDLQEDHIVKEFLQSHRIQWQHQIPRSPWMGGHFERLVRTIKTSLSAAISIKIYNVEEFTTIVKEVESIVNMCPLTYQSTESYDQPLTPSQLLCGRDISIMPPLLQPNTDDSDNESRELRHQYYLISNALDKFRRRWSSEYLTSLREKHLNLCAQRPTHHLKPDSLVMIKHENLHRYEWPLGKVLRVFPDPQGIFWTVEVEEGGKVSFRSVIYLVPLELDCNDEEGNNTETERAYDNQEASFSEADKPLPVSASTARAISSSSSEQSEDPFMQSAVMPVSGLHETPSPESADPTQRDSLSPSQRSSVGATSKVTMETRAVDSPQSPTPSLDSAPRNAAPSSRFGFICLWAIG